jgi:ABC-2 type transport system ATP-binding protein
MSDSAAIEVVEVYKSFKLPHEKQGSLKNAFIGIFSSKKTYEKQQVLNGISFDIKKGEFFGLVGRNGSGKSTLLKLLAGVYSPDSGLIKINGRLTPFIELGVGFNPELTGRENVYLNGALLGFSRTEITEMYKDIVDFAELEKFMDQKLKNYSSGMQVRLAFSIAIRAKSDILLLDEVLAVGDASFQQKCFDYFEELKREKRTVVLVTHDMSSVMRFCDRALILKKGEIKSIGSTEEISNLYLLENISNTESSKKNTGDSTKLKKQVSKFTTKVTSDKKLSQSDSLCFEISYQLSENLNVDLGYSITSNGISVAEQNTKKVSLPNEAGVLHKITCKIPLSNFNSGTYSLDTAIFTHQNFELIGYENRVSQFIIAEFDETRGATLKTDGVWEVYK